ncbi:Pro-resilin-like 14 [Homarus americanus]|uniref:Pro-resilin-like 14 n=2 Tax=Homarus americanus TaxID=6706 RepID=A0A8J5K7M2_HOMAM|nr:Pro-resilin-like 14 [Homarus americanus]
MDSKVFIFLGLVAMAGADRRPSYSYSDPESSEDSLEEPTKYGYNWNVKDGYSGNDFTHQEDREDDNTKGSYSVQLPDGRLQTVTYYVDGDSGFVAEVKYEGEAQYPESEESKEYTPTKPRYFTPDSEESVEVPVYTQPRK